MQNITQQNRAIAIPHSVIKLLRDSKSMITRSCTSPNKVKPTLRLVHHSIGGDAEATASAPFEVLLLDLVSSNGSKISCFAKITLQSMCKSYDSSRSIMPSGFGPTDRCTSIDQRSMSTRASSDKFYLTL